MIDGLLLYPEYQNTRQIQLKLGLKDKTNIYATNFQASRKNSKYLEKLLRKTELYNKLFPSNNNNNNN